MMPHHALKCLSINMPSFKKLTIAMRFINHFLRISQKKKHFQLIDFYSNPNNTRNPIDFSKPPNIDSGLESVLDLILRTVSADWVYLEEIFDSPRNVMDTLLKKVFEEIVTFKCTYILIMIVVFLDYATHRRGIKMCRYAFNNSIFALPFISILWNAKIY